MVYLFLDINECQSDPCFDEATCVDGVNEYTCECQPGYTGEHCDTGILLTFKMDCNSQINMAYIVSE